MHDTFGVLTVVHRAYAWNEAQQSCNRGAGLTRNGRPYRRLLSRETGGEAGFAVDCGADDTGALLAERLAAVLAEGYVFTIGVVGAVHAWSLLFCWEEPCWYG